MGAFSPYSCKVLLDFVCGGAAVTQPTERWLALTDINGDEISASGYARRSVAFGAAASPWASATMLAGQTFGPFSLGSPVSVFSFHIGDNNSGGNVLVGSAFETPHTCGNNYGVVVASISVTLS